MKYAVPIYEYKLFGIYGEGTYNIGDFIQSYCIHEFYKSIGVNDGDIIFLSIEELSNYSGPYVIVLLNMYGGMLNMDFSPHVIPVFWGFSFTGFINDRMK